MVELVRAGRTPESLSREFEPSAQTISNWARQVNLDEGRRDDGALRGRYPLAPAHTAKSRFTHQSGDPLAFAASLDARNGQRWIKKRALVG